MSQIPADNFDFSQAGLSGVFFVDQAYSEKHAHMIHQHTDVMELLYIASGEGRYFIRNREYAVHTGDLIICNADTLHGETPFQNHSMQTYCCAFSGICLPKLPKGCLVAKEQRPVLKLESYAAAIGRIMPTIYELYSSSPDHAAICRQLAISLLMMSWSSLQEHNHQGNLLLEQKNEVLISRITEYLNRHYTEPLTLKSICKAMHISESHLSHLYKRETGLSPIQYIIHRRIGEAQSLLMETRLPIHQIEEMLGFGSSCHFTSMFKKYVGISPREYRNHFCSSIKPSNY